jgi:hypothetical protein
MMESAVAMAMLGASGFTLVVLLTTLGVNNLQSHVERSADAEITNFLSVGVARGEVLNQSGVTALGVPWGTTAIEIEDVLVDGLYKNVGTFTNGGVVTTKGVVIFRALHD